MPRPEPTLTLFGVLLLSSAAAGASRARPACALLTNADVARLVGKPVGVQKESSMGAAHVTACRNTADEKTTAAVADVVQGVGDAACASIDTVNVLKGQTVQRVRVPGMPSPAWRTKTRDVAKSVLPKL